MANILSAGTLMAVWHMKNVCISMSQAVSHQFFHLLWINLDIMFEMKKYALYLWKIQYVQVYKTGSDEFLLLVTRKIAIQVGHG